MSGVNYTANGTIQPSRFVIIDPSTSDRVVQASATSNYPLAGISQEWSAAAPINNASAAAAVAGDQIAVYGPTDVCFLQATSAGWTAGDLLTSDQVGQGVKATGTQYYGAVAISTLSSAGLGRVQVIPFVRNP